MQKKLIALAIAGLSGAAFAQSNVTVYGVADASYDFISVSGGVTSNSNQNFSRVSTNSSLIGFKGVEDVGNGLKAVFQYESSVGFDAQGALGASRDSFVALAGGFGTVALGNLTGPTRAFGAAVDVNAGATGIGANAGLIGKLGNILKGRLDTAVTTPATAASTAVAGVTDQVQLTSRCGRSQTCASAYDERFANAIAYISPDMGGFTVIAGYIPNEGKNSAGNPSAYDLGLKYANGPILVGLSHVDVKLKNAADIHTYNTRLVGSYDFGMASVRALWEQGKGDGNGVGSVKQNVWGLGATFSVSSAGKIIGQYYRANDATGTGTLLSLAGNSATTGSDTGATLWELGYEHSLSKRTMLKAVYARIDNKAKATYDFGVNASGTVSADAQVSGLQVGLRHSF